MKPLKKYKNFLIKERLTFKKRDVISDIGGYDTDIEDAHQSIMNLGYSEWQQQKDWNYSEMLEWVEEKYGELVRFAIQIGKYNQQVTNGGHAQYYSNGYASGGGGFMDNHEGDIGYHEELVDLLGQASELEEFDWYTELYSIMSKFDIKVDDEKHTEDYCEECDNGWNECKECWGSGEADCQECNGDGEVEGDDGDFDTCDECGGDGKSECEDCDGGGSECYECDGTGEVENENEHYGEITNQDELDELDSRYYKIDEKIIDDLEKYFRKRLELSKYDD